jgi:chromosome segregation ATPase
MTINNFDDILRAMEQDPALRDAMRRHILTEELLQLPAQVTRLETSVDRLETSVDRLETSVDRLETRMDNLEAGQEEIKGRMDKLEDGQSRLEAGQEELKGRVSTMAGRLGAIVGSDYEARSLRVAPRKLRQVMGIRNATLILAARQTPLKDILPVLDRAMTSGKITEAEAEDLENVDLAFTGEDPSGNTVQAAIEASITISLEDIRRAIRRAEILERATMVPSRAAVIGENISQEDQTEAGNLGVAFLYMPAHRE